MHVHIPDRLLCTTGRVTVYLVIIVDDCYRHNFPEFLFFLFFFRPFWITFNRLTGTCNKNTTIKVAGFSLNIKEVIYQAKIPNVHCFQFLSGMICCFSLFYIIVNWTYFGIGLCVEESYLKMEDVSCVLTFKKIISQLKKLLTGGLSWWPGS